VGLSKVSGFLAFDADIFGSETRWDALSRAKVAPRLEEELRKAGESLGGFFMVISRFARSGSGKNAHLRSETTLL
jgi:hypothetical protein